MRAARADRSSSPNGFRRGEEMLRYEQNDYYSAPPAPYAPPSPTPPSRMPMSPPAHPRPQFYGPQGRAVPELAPHAHHGRRRASTSAARASGAAAGPRGFPMLQLNMDQAEQLRAIESKLLEQYLERYDAFVELNQRTVDTGLWKLARQANGVKAYKRRGATTSRSSSNRAALRARRGLRSRGASLAMTPDETDEPMLLVVGSIDGTLEDVLYGAVWHSRDERSSRTYYTKDGIVDASVLASLEKPSSMHPFRSLAVKWSLKRSMRSAAVIKDRDFVFLGATGTIRSRTDERIGYELRHSLKIPSCPPIAGSSIVRAEIMSCSFFRQMRGGRVEVFHQASFDAGGGLLSILAWNHAVDNYIGFASIIECSFMKKLVRAVQWSSDNPPVKTDDDPQAKPWDPEERRCGVCGQQSGSIQRKCAVCRAWVCSHCSARKEIFTPLPGRPSVARCFCKTCLLKVQRDDPTDYVLRELEQFEHRTATEYAHNPEIAVLEPRNGVMPPPPPPPPSEPSEAVFFAIDGSPPPPPPSVDGGAFPTGRRRQGSVPMLPIPPLAPPPMPEPTRQSERFPQRKRFVSDATDENQAPNVRGSVEYRASGQARERDVAAVGRARRPSAAASSRATKASNNPRGEIFLRSDSEHKKWRHRELEQQQQQQQQHEYDDRRSAAVAHRKTELMPSSCANGSTHRRRMTVLGSEAPPMPPQPQLQAHRYRRPTTEPMMSAELASERRGSVDNGGRRQSMVSNTSDIPPPPPPTQYRDSDSDTAPSRRATVTLAPRDDRLDNQEPVPTRSTDIYGHLRAGRLRTASSDENGRAPGQRFLSQYEELIPRSVSVLEEEPLPEPRQHSLLPTPEPQALTARRALQQSKQEQTSLPPPPSRPPTSARPSSRAPAPTRPDGPMQVRLSLLEQHEQELLQREYQELKREQLWIQHEQEQYINSNQPRTQQQRVHAKPQVEPAEDPSQPQHDEPGFSPDNQLSDRHERERTAREKDELEVNSLLAELCEIARMTNDYAHSNSSSMHVTAAASASTHDRIRTLATP